MTMKDAQKGYDLMHVESNSHKYTIVIKCIFFGIYRKEYDFQSTGYSLTWLSFVWLFIVRNEHAGWG